MRHFRLNERIPFMMWIPPVGDFIEQSKDYLGFYARRAAMGDKYGGFINWTMRHLLVAVHNPETARKVTQPPLTTFICNSVVRSTNIHRASSKSHSQQAHSPLVAPRCPQVVICTWLASSPNIPPFSFLLTSSPPPSINLPQLGSSWPWMT